MSSNTVTVGQKEDGNDVAWTYADTTWSLSIFGAAVGAGILFLPINAGIGGIWPLIVLSVLLSPLTYITHRSVLRFCLSATHPASDFGEAANEHLGKTGGLWMVFAYFAFIFPIVMAYSIGITNTIESLISEQLNWGAPSRALLSLGLVLVLVGIVNGGEKVILKMTALLVYPLGATLLAVSLYLIPQWHLEQFYEPVSFSAFTKGFLSTLPILIFSLAFIPVCSAMAQSFHCKIKEVGLREKKTEQITFRGTALLLFTTLFFTFSCVLTLTPLEMMAAKESNISVMTVFALRSDSHWFSIVTSIVAVTAICSSFLNYYLGAREGLSGLIQRIYAYSGRGAPSKHRLNRLITIFYVVVLWLVGYLNWGVIDIMGAIAAPLMAVILYIMPVYAIRKTPKLQRYASSTDALAVIVGVVCIGAYIMAAVI